MTDHSGHNPVCDYRYPTRTCGRGNLAVRSSWDNVTSPLWGGRASQEGARRLLAPRRSGARVDGMANPGELPINAVRTDKPKALRGLDQKVSGQVQGYPPSPAVAVGATGGEAEPTPSGIHPWDVVSPSSSLRVGPPQGAPTGRRVEDEGRSECPAVTGGIGVESSGEITPRESGPTSLGCLRTRPSEQLAQETEQMTAASLLVRSPACSARWPQTSIVQVERQRCTGSREGP